MPIFWAAVRNATRATSSGTPIISYRMRPGLTTATHSSGLPLPLPIRVSAGFFVTGLSGNTRIQTLPPRLRLRVRATRAASIWRLVTQPGSSALSPYSPNDSVEPRCALPRMFPRWALRYLTRLGISMGRLLGLGGRGGSQDLALEDPDLDADRPRRRVRGGETVIDVRADRVQRHAPVAVPLAARDLAAAQPARARDADAVGAQPERGRHRLLHRPPEGHALLQLQRDVLGYELRVQLGVDDLLDVEVDLLPRARLELVLQLLHLGALAADDDAGPRGEDGDPRAVRRALDVDLRDAGVVELVLDEAPDLDVLVQEVGVVLRREPARRPRPGRAEAEADRMRLLTHRLFLLLGLASAPGGRLGRGRLGRGRPGGRPPRGGRRGGGGCRRRRRAGRARGRDAQGAVGLVADADGEVAGAVLDEEGAPHRARLHALHRGAAVGDGLHHAQVVEVADLVVVLRVRHRRAQHLFDETRGRARRVLQRGQGVAHRLAADLVEDEPRLPRGDAHEPGAGDSVHGIRSSPSARRRPSRPGRAP